MNPMFCCRFFGGWIPGRESGLTEALSGDSASPRRLAAEGVFALAAEGVDMAVGALCVNSHGVRAVVACAASPNVGLLLIVDNLLLLGSVGVFAGHDDWVS